MVVCDVGWFSVAPQHSLTYPNEKVAMTTNRSNVFQFEWKKFSGANSSAINLGWIGCGWDQTGFASGVALPNGGLP